MPKYDITKTKIFIAAAAFATILPTLTYFGVHVPKPAWSYELEDLEEGQLDIAVDLYQRELSRQRYENLKLQRKQQEIENEKGYIPESYLKEQEYIESDIKDIMGRIKKAERQILKIQEN